MGQPLNLTGQTFGYLTAIEPTDKRDKNGSVYWRCKCRKCGKETEAIARDLKRGRRTSCGCTIGENARIKMKARADSLGGTLPGQQNMKVPTNNTTGIKGVAKYYIHGKFSGYRAYLTYQGKQYSGGVFTTLEEASKARKDLEERYYHAHKKDVMAEKRYQDILTIQAFYKEHGRPPVIKDFGNKAKAMSDRHGSWNELIIKASYKPARVKNKEKWTKESLAEFAIKTADNGELNFCEFPKRQLAVKLFGSWANFLKETGLKKKKRTEPNYLDKPFTQYTYDELLEHLRRREEELGRPPTLNDVTIFSYYVDKFGSWNNALRQAGIKGKYGWGKYTESELIDLAQQQCDETGYLSTGKYTHYYQAVKRFGNWDAFKKRAGLLEKKNSTDIKEIQAFYDQHGRPPLTKDFGGRYRAIVNRYGSWNNALLAAGITPTRGTGSVGWTKDRLRREAQKYAVDGQLHLSDFPKRHEATKVFGSWTQFLKETGLEKRRKKEPNYLNKPFTKYTDEELINHLKQRAIDLVRSPTVLDVTISPMILKRFGSWEKALELAGLTLLNAADFLTTDELITKAQKESELGYISSKKFSHYYQVRKEFGNWENFKKRAGLLDKELSKLSMRRIRTMKNKTGVVYRVSSIGGGNIGTFKTLIEAQKARDDDDKNHNK